MLFEFIYIYITKDPAELSESHMYVLAPCITINVYIDIILLDNRFLQYIKPSQIVKYILNTLHSCSYPIYCMKYTTTCMIRGCIPLMIHTQLLVIDVNMHFEDDSQSTTLHGYYYISQVLWFCYWRDTIIYTHT